MTQQHRQGRQLLTTINNCAVQIDGISRVKNIILLQ